ncbi:MAG TPA: hypothetical protein DEG43_15505 [Acidimicrobiaceae bacterium]|nr:hypothetical protein [Acidimicrobiaceae bacterium]
MEKNQLADANTMRRPALNQEQPPHRRLGKSLKGKPLWLRLLIMLALILASGTRCYLAAQTHEARTRPIPTYCVPEDPARIDYLSVDGVWSETSTPGSIRALVYRSPRTTDDQRVIDLPEGWKLDSAPEAQRAALQPSMVGDYLMMMYPPAECFTGTSAAR